MAGIIALYLRISLDDEKQDESDSIANQRDLLRSYATAALPAGEIVEFIDDGWSGTNFNRPRVQELLNMARRGEVGCILVKDLSRWGRNYPEVNQYMDQIFPFLCIRFISINDRYDSNDYHGTTAPIDVAFSSIMHDIYSKELSVKIRQSYTAKAEKGEYVCGRPPFGYVRSAHKTNQLVIDKGAAAIVRRIFDMATTGMTSVKIAATLNEEGVDTATSWYRRNGRFLKTAGADEDGRTYWSNTQVIRIVREELYTGTLVCFKSKRSAVGNRRQVKIPESEWLRIPNTHEAIVTAEQFAAANAKLRCNKKSATRGIDSNRSPLTGKIKCGHCGRAMKYQNALQSYHYCSGMKLGKGKGCFDGKVYLEAISDAVLLAVQTEAQKAFDAAQRRKQMSHNSATEREAIFTERKRLIAQTALLERRGIALYEEFAEGRLDKDGYRAAKAVCAAELADTEARITELNIRLERLAAKVEQPCNEPLLQQVLDAENVTDEVLALVDCIVVYDPERIEIRLAFTDTNLLEVVNG